MTPALSTTAWVLHDLGLATSFGGSLFGKVALHPAVREVSSRDERGRVVEAAWKGFNVWHTIALGAVGFTWLVGRSMLTGREIDRTTRTLVFVKDALVAASVATGVGTAVVGVVLSRSDAGHHPPLESGSTPAPEAPRRSVALLRTVDALGYANLATIAGVIGVTAVLAMKAGTSHKWGALSRLLP